ncbi:hypothetical protein ACE7GA_17620 [Roseomonas sp. CCTCC AB2023176]|uniref:hypothetical protein n=1 Tax=Roseomonas sp. CCTCC AB2023176 TaxID=3342640 RepID=UPI0035D6D15C
MPARRCQPSARPLKEPLRVEGWTAAHADAFPSLELAGMASRKRLQRPATLWCAPNIAEWPRAGSFGRMLADNDAARFYLRDALAASGAPPLRE